MVTVRILLKPGQVIKGRCGDYVIEGKTPEAALEKMDKQRSTYYNYYTGKVWGKCDHYDLCINAGRLGVEYSTDIILEYINRLKK